MGTDPKNECDTKYTHTHTHTHKHKHTNTHTHTHNEKECLSFVEVRQQKTKKHVRKKIKKLPEFC